MIDQKVRLANLFRRIDLAADGGRRVNMSHQEVNLLRGFLIAMMEITQTNNLSPDEMQVFNGLSPNHRRTREDYN